MLRSLDEAGGPVLEEVAGTDDVLVTFACLRDDPAVTLRTPLVSLVADSNPDGDIILQRLPNTRLWYTSMLVDRRVSTSYQFRVPGASPGLEAEVEQSLLLNPSGLQAFARAMLPRGFADASNPEKLFPHYGVLAGTSSGGTPAALWESVLTLPGAEPFPYLDGAAERGRVVERDFSTTATPGVRTVGVYLPVGYDSRKEYPLVVAVDGEFYRRVARLPEILDAAIVSGVIPPVIVAFWHNQDASSRQRELACSADFLSAIADEFYPWIEATFSVSTAPRERVITGFSLGGLGIGLGRARTARRVRLCPRCIAFAVVHAGSGSRTRMADSRIRHGGETPWGLLIHWRARNRFARARRFPSFHAGLRSRVSGRPDRAPRRTVQLPRGARWTRLRSCPQGHSERPCRAPRRLTALAFGEWGRGLHRHPGRTARLT